jgi:hypothetical protein
MLVKHFCLLEIGVFFQEEKFDIMDGFPCWCLMKSPQDHKILIEDATMW